MPPKILFLRIYKYMFKITDTVNKQPAMTRMASGKETAVESNKNRQLGLEMNGNKADKKLVTANILPISLTPLTL